MNTDDRRTGRLRKLMFRMSTPVRRVARHLTRGTTIVVLGLLALSGTAYAANTVFSSDIVDGQVFSVDVANNSLTGTDVQDGSLTGADINEASLNFGPSGIGCKTGTVLGFARVKGAKAGFPNIYTSSSMWVDIVRNCSGGSVQVRRASTGVFMVRFVGNPAALAHAPSDAHR